MESHINNTLTERCKELEAKLGTLRIRDTRISLYDWGNEERLRLNQISKDKLFKLIETRVCAIAIEAHRKSVNTRYCPDDYAPKLLAYALVHGVFTAEERSQLRYCHGETETTFISEFYQEGLIEVLYKELTTERVPKPMPPSDHCCC